MRTTGMITAAQRKDWIEDYFQQLTPGALVSQVDDAFVSAYLAAFPGTKHEVRMVGPIVCRQIYRDLTEMVEEGTLKRYRIKKDPFHYTLRYHRKDIAA